MGHVKDNLETLTIIDELREEVRQLRAALSPPVNPFYGNLGLTPSLLPCAMRSICTTICRRSG